MSITIAGKLIPQPAALSDLGRLALAFIDGGMEWVAWAANTPLARYDFTDETQLVATVQNGLHASRCTLLPGLKLMVSPVKLMTLGLADLRVLAKAEGGDDSAVGSVQVRRVLADHQLTTQGDLAAAMGCLAEQGVGEHALFQSMSFEDKLEVCLLMSQPQPEQDPALLREAAAFGARQARTPLEFCDYYRLYLDRAAQLDTQATPAQREAAAAEAMQALLPMLFGALDCPQIKGLAGPQEVGATVSNWLTRGRQVGFARLSRGVQQLVRHAPYKGETGDAARRVAELYLRTAQSFLAAHRIEGGLMGQDGATCLFPIDGGSLRMVLQMNSGGVISLHEFGARPAPVTPPAVPAAIDTTDEEISS
jgi:hypothetical protein